MADREDLLSAYQYFSTLSLEAFRFENLMDSVVGDDGKVWVDPADPDMLRLFELPRNTRITYDGSRAITSISADVYGNTSLWFLILGCTAYIHPHQIPRGETIVVPSQDAVITYLQAKQKAKGLQGQTIII